MLRLKNAVPMRRMVDFLEINPDQVKFINVG